MLDLMGIRLSATLSNLGEVVLTTSACRGAERNTAKPPAQLLEVTQRQRQAPDVEVAIWVEYGVLVPVERNDRMSRVDGLI